HRGARLCPYTTLFRSDPVPLGFLTGWMLDDRVHSVGRVRAVLTHRPEFAVADLPGQRLIGHPVAEVFEFVAQGPRPQMRIFPQRSEEHTSELQSRENL